MAEPCAPIVIPALHNTMGCLFIGAALAGALWGVTSVQTYNYFLEYYKSDRPVFLFMVGGVYALDTAHQIMLLHLVYTYLVSNFGNPVILGTLLWSILMMVLLTAFIGLTVQTFLVYRVWLLSRKNYIVAGLVYLPVLALFATTLAYFAKAWNFTTLVQLGEVDGFSKAVNVLGVVSDMGITAALSFYLWSSKSGMRKTDAIVNRLILFCVRTGFLTSTCAILSLITISALPATFIYITFYSTLARWYTTSLLATLNARSSLRNQDKGTNSLANVSYENAPRVRPTIHDTDSQVRHITIKQDVETMIHNDSVYEMKPTQGL